MNFTKSLESSGISMLTIHGRTYNQAFRGDADWEPIHELKSHLKIPVIGNGDIVITTKALRNWGIWTDL